MKIKYYTKFEIKKTKYLLSKYGITLTKWKATLKEQDFRCALCKLKTLKLNQDHRHVKDFKILSVKDKRKESRGLLCFRCNKFTLGGLEIHKNAREVLENLLQYAQKYKLKGD